MFVLRGHSDRVRSLAFTPDGSLLASASEDGDIRLWDARKGKPDRVLSEHGQAVFGVAFGPDGGRVYSCGHDGRLLAWPLEGNSVPRTLLTSARSLVAMAVSPDGQIVAAGGDRVVRSQPGEELDTSLRVFDVAFDKERQASHLPDRRQPVWSLAFDPTSQTLAVGLSNGKVRLWERSRNRMEESLDHRVAVRALAFSPDGSVLVTAPGTPAYMWDLATQRVRHRFGEIRHSVESVAFSPDGTLLTGCLDSTVR
jgi:WD40 repeat protein